MSCRLIVNARFLTQRLTGVQRFATEISLSLRRLLGDEVKFVSPKNILNSEIAKQLEVEIVGSHSGYFWEQIELPNYLKHQGNPPLLNLCNMAPILYKNSYVTVHDILWVKYPQLYSSLFTAVYNWLIPTLCRRAKKVFTVSNNSKYDLMAYTKMPASHFDVIYNAVSGDFSPVPDEDLRAENYFLAVSSMKANKNFPMVLASFKKLQATLPDVRLYIIGDLQDKNFNAVNLAEYIDNPKIQFLGRVTDEQLIRYYSNAIAFIFPSYYEGFGIPVLEAQACGCPVISSNSSSLPEVLHDSALMVNPDDCDAFVSNMYDIATDDNLRKRIISAGISNIKHFSWEESAKVISQILKA